MIFYTIIVSSVNCKNYNVQLLSTIVKLSYFHLMNNYELDGVSSSEDDIGRSIVI